MAFMFTGIIRHIGTVRRLQATPAGKRLTIEVGPLAEGLALGDSVAVSGACLSVTSLRGSEADFDVVAETLSRTKLGGLGRGSRANLERPLRLSDELHGHLVQGHVDGMAKVRRIERGQEIRISFTATREITAAMIPKGSVAVDGVSLTIAELTEDGFTVAIIPTTWEETTLSELSAGDAVNIETDLIGKYVLRGLGRLQIPSSASSLTMEKLRQAGFE